MILEQAFLHLPEILHGSGYQQQDYESGIVGAFSLAVLQILNGHNSTNPISCLQHERLFRSNGVYAGLDDPRYLRADLFVDISKLYVANRRLSQYGWRHNCWIEAKFLRKQTGNGIRHSGNKTTNVANFLADLIRLCTLIPEDGDSTSQGRYFLHVYDSDPKWYLTFGNRSWMKALCSSGEQRLRLNNLGREPGTIKRLLGDFGELTIDIVVTNTVVTPLIANHPPCYWMYLTRIDEIDMTWDGRTVKFNKDRTIEKSSGQALNEIAAFVASTIHIDPTSIEVEEPVETERPDNLHGLEIPVE